MRRRNLLLSLAAAIALGGALITLNEPGGHSGKAEQPLISGFEAALNDITQIRIVATGREVDLNRGADAQHWTVQQMGDYPADLGRLREFLDGLGQSRLIEAKTSKPENYAKLGLDDRGLIHVIVAKGKETAADLLIGRTADKTRQTFVRYPDNAQVWLVSGTLRPFTTPIEWIRQEVLNIGPDRVKRVVIHHAQGSDVAIARDSPKAEVEITPAPPAKNEPLAYQIQTALRALAHLDMTQVTPQSALTASKPDMAMFETFDGLTINFRFSGNSHGEWLTIDAAAAPSAAAGIKDEAAAINARSKGWAYQFAPYIMTQLKLSADELTKSSGTGK